MWPVTPGGARRLPTFGPYPVGRLHVELHDAARDRTLPVEIWYPATSAAKADFDLGGPITDVWTESENA